NGEQPVNAEREHAVTGRTGGCDETITKMLPGTGMYTKGSRTYGPRHSFPNPVSWRAPLSSTEVLFPRYFLRPSRFRRSDVPSFARKRQFVAFMFALAAVFTTRVASAQT